MTQPKADALPMEHLFEARERFVAYVRQRVSDPELAEDIVQDSLLRALRAGPELRDQERLVPWFFQVLRNAIVDEYRKRDVVRRHVEMTDELPDMPDLSGTKRCRRSAPASGHCSRH